MVSCSAPLATEVRGLEKFLMDLKYSMSHVWTIMTPIT
jgi:hypothetical protein